MEKDQDHQGWMGALEALFPVMVLRGVLPKYLRGLLLVAALFSPAIRKGLPAMGTLSKASIDGVTKRQGQLERNEPTRQDMMAKAYAIYEADLHDEKKTSRQKMLLEDVHGEALVALYASATSLHLPIYTSNVSTRGAGSETTAIALRAILYKLITHPQTLQKLRTELATAEEEGRLSRPFIRYSEAIKLPYTIACCKEAMRLHPSIALTFPRFVPAQGLKLSDTFLPAGYKVGISPAVLQYNRVVFGDDAQVFRPERWLGEGAARMERYMMVFGAGKRTCIGINVSDRPLGLVLSLDLEAKQ